MKTDLEKLTELLQKNPELVSQILNLAGSEQEETPSGNKFECGNCGHALFLEKPKKVCPKCKKHKLQPVLEDVKPANKNASFTTSIKGAGNPLDKRLAKKQQLGKFTNEFKDDEDLCKEDVEIDKALWKNRKPTPRPNQARTITIAKCANCSKTEEVPKIVTSKDNDYICNDCIISARNRQGR